MPHFKEGLAPSQEEYEEGENATDKTSQEEDPGRYKEFENEETGESMGAP